MYQWGYQAGQQAARFLKSKSTDGLKPEIVQVRRRVYNTEQAKKYKINFGLDLQSQHVVLNVKKLHADREMAIVLILPGKTPEQIWRLDRSPRRMTRGEYIHVFQ